MNLTTPNIHAMNQSTSAFQLPIFNIIAPTYEVKPSADKMLNITFVSISAMYLEKKSVPCSIISEGQELEARSMKVPSSM